MIRPIGKTNNEVKLHKNTRGLSTRSSHFEERLRLHEVNKQSVEYTKIIPINCIVK